MKNALDVVAPPLKETREMLDFLVELANLVTKSYKSKKLDWSLFSSFLPVMIKLQTAFDGAEKISFELETASDKEKQTLYDVFDGLDIDHKTMEAMVKDVFAAICMLHKVYLLIKKHAK